MTPSSGAHGVNIEKYELKHFYIGIILIILRFSPYKCNMDYYRGKVKSVYEKEPVFKDFVRNIPLSESNFNDSTNLSRIKHRFNNIMQDKWGRDQTPDPFKPSGVSLNLKGNKLKHFSNFRSQVGYLSL